MMARPRFGAIGPFLAAAAVFVCCLKATPVVAQSPSAVELQLQEARQAYEQLNYEATRDLLTALIGRLTQGDIDDSQRKVLAGAYELRGRTLQNLRDADAARADFRFMLNVDPTYPFPTEAGSRALSLFEEVRAATVGTVEITITPADADVQIDRRPATQRPLRVTLVAGFHTLAASRRGHTSVGQQFEVRPGESSTIALTLQRESSTVTLQTIPANVMVYLDGTLRGPTLLDPNAPSQADASAAAPSQPFQIEELQKGRHRLEFRRDCFLDEQRQVDVQQPDNIKLEPIRLSAAVGTITVRSDAAGATVFVDNNPKGAPTQVLSECQGPHVVEVRTRIGRHVRRFDLKAGQKEEFVAVVRPAFAIVSDSDANVGVTGTEDLRLVAETAFRDTKTLTLFASPEPRTKEIATSERLSGDWLAFDSLGAPINNAAKLGAPGRKAAGSRFAKEFEAQGVAAIARDPAGIDKAAMLLVLLAPGSARPDVLKWRTDSATTVRQAIARLDATPAVTRASLGMLALDVLDVPGAVVGSVEPGGGAAAAGLQPGDVVTAVAGAPISTAAALLAAVANTPPAQPLSLDVRDRTGGTKKVEVAVQMMPRLPELLDESVLANTLAVALTARSLTPATPVEDAAVRLNLAVAWIRLENWDAAIRELEAIDSLMAGSSAPARVKEAISANVQYLLGVCAEKSDNAAGAEQAWTKAAQSPSTLLTDSGEPLKELSERRLAELRAARGGR